MKWNSTQRDKLPKDAQEVLISVEGINYVAVYNKTKDIFMVTKPTKTIYKASDSLIYWTEYTRPV